MKMMGTFPDKGISTGAIDMNIRYALNEPLINLPIFLPSGIIIITIITIIIIILVMLPRYRLMQDWRLCNLPKSDTILIIIIIIKVIIIVIVIDIIIVFIVILAIVTSPSDPWTQQWVRRGGSPCCLSWKKLPASCLPSNTLSTSKPQYILYILYIYMYIFLSWTKPPTSCSPSNILSKPTSTSQYLNNYIYISIPQYLYNLLIYIVLAVLGFTSVYTVYIRSISQYLISIYIDLYISICISIYICILCLPCSGSLTASKTLIRCLSLGCNQRDRDDIFHCIALHCIALQCYAMKEKWGLTYRIGPGVTWGERVVESFLVQNYVDNWNESA